ncbi:MAG TPA: VOC family protein [Rhizomicrobium sp.]
MSHPSPASPAQPAAEYYPMPSFPMLLVADLVASSRWYQEALGFADVFTMRSPDGAPVLVHLRWRKYADLLLRPGQPAHEKKGVGIILNFACNDSVEALDALAERARAAGAHFIQEPGDRAWNVRDFTVADPDGFALTFSFGPLKQNVSMDELQKSIRKA